MATPTTEPAGYPSEEATASRAVAIAGSRDQLLRAGHAESDPARAAWNGAVDRRARLIARHSGTADVGAAVRCARAHDLAIAVRGGGHTVAGTGTQTSAPAKRRCA